MPGRSPHRRSPPPPPLISRGRVRSPERHHEVIPSTSRGARREFRPSVRGGRSSLESKRRSFTPPPLKRKAVFPIRERELPRKAKISKSPVSSRVSSELRTYAPAVPEDNGHTVVRSVSETDRYTEYERAGPQFRGPEGSVNFDINELKKFTVEIIRKPVGVSDDSIINRSIANPESIAPIRRPDEGSRPLFMRAEVSASSSKERLRDPEDYTRIVAIDPSRVTGRDRTNSERPRYSSPPRYEEQRRPYYPERELSPYEPRPRSSPPPIREEYESRDIKPRERVREVVSVREDLRRDLDVKRREERRFSPERRSSYERESDLRTRINEKRSEPHTRSDEREHSSRRYESERERHSSRSHAHSPPPRERRRGGSGDRREESRGREEKYERERESGGERRRRPHSREREERGGRDRERYEESDRSRRPQSYEPKKFYKSYEEKEFVPYPTRGRGGPPIRRGMPHTMRGRGIVRGMARGFRGAPMGMVRGMPRGPFIPRGFPPHG